jgi:hypothetical protein
MNRWKPALKAFAITFEGAGSSRPINVIINELPDGSWGGQGRIFRLGDILSFAGAGQDDIEVRVARLRQSAPV